MKQSLLRGVEPSPEGGNVIIGRHLGRQLRTCRAETRTGRERDFVAREIGSTRAVATVASCVLHDRPLAVVIGGIVLAQDRVGLVLDLVRLHRRELALRDLRVGYGSLDEEL